MERIVSSVLKSLTRAGLVEVEVSARHVHLSRRDLETLFGAGAELTPERPLSQPGQFLSRERVALVGKKSRRERTAVLGPVRAETQVELSGSDCFELGVAAPIRESGDLEGSGAITIEGPAGSTTICRGVIIARSHVHLTPDAAAEMGVRDKQHVGVEVLTERPVVFEDVVIRVSGQFRCRMHIDFDEANAAAVGGFTLGRIIKR